MCALGVAPQRQKQARVVTPSLDCCSGAATQCRWLAIDHLEVDRRSGLTLAEDEGTASARR
jgi:hypothetical protein